MERAPAVAGLFYPADAGSLRQTVLECLGEPSAAPVKPVAAVVPHAGYAYSGRTAGRVYGAVTVPEGVILLGPNHTGMGRPASVWVEGDWLTPLGKVPVATEMAAALVGAHLAPLQLFDPFLESDIRRLDRADLRNRPSTVGHDDGAPLTNFANQLAELRLRVIDGVNSHARIIFTLVRLVNQPREAPGRGRGGGDYSA